MGDFRLNVEDMIIEMGNIVRENRYLRKENKCLKEVEEDYHKVVYERMKDSEANAQALLDFTTLE